MALTGRSLVGDKATRCRVDNDFYATPESSILALLTKENFNGNILEPACGNGAISKVLERFGYNVYSSDLVFRGYGIGGIDFLKHSTIYDNIITNPPFCLISQFIEKGLSLSRYKLAIFAKIQLLEGKHRKFLLKNSPLKTIYVFSERQNPLRNGIPVDENGRKWCSTMCFAWFLWDKSYKGNPTIDWL
jgi:hypothetical protein